MTDPSGTTPETGPDDTGPAPDPIVPGPAETVWVAADAPVDDDGELAGEDFGADLDAAWAPDVEVPPVDPDESPRPRPPPGRSSARTSMSCSTTTSRRRSRSWRWSAVPTSASPRW